MGMLMSAAYSWQWTRSARSPTSRWYRRVSDQPDTVRDTTDASTPPEHDPKRHQGVRIGTARLRRSSLLRYCRRSRAWRRSCNPGRRPRQPPRLVGGLIGAALVFVFAVARHAQSVAPLGNDGKSRRQFRPIPASWPEPRLRRHLVRRHRVRASLRQMIAQGCAGSTVPILVGLILLGGRGAALS